MRAWLVLLVLCCVSCAPTRPQEDQLRLDMGKTLAEAESAVHQGVANKTRLLAARKHFSDAADAYLKLHTHGGARSPALYRNLGNAAVLADRWPEAMWAYHSGLKLDPNDRVLREQLAFLRAKVLYPPAGQGRPERNVWPAWLYRPAHVELVSLLVFSYVCLWLGIAICWVKRTMIAACVVIGMAVVTLIAGFGWSQDRQQQQMDRDTPLVVLVANTDFYRGNATSYPKHEDMPYLPRGLEARQLHRRGAWLQIRLTSGEVGWVHAGNARIVTP